jgi:hypothetical protein
MAVNCGVSFGLCAIRVTEVDGLGNVVGGAGTGYVSDKAVSVNVTPNVETGNTFSRRNGCGCSLARFKSIDIFNWWEFTFEDGALEPALVALMLGNETIVDGADVVGQAFGTALGCDEDPPAVAFEFWTKHIVGSGQDAIHPYVHWVFPHTSWVFGDNTAEEDFMANQVTGFSQTNPNWGQGPYGDGPPDGQDISNGGYWKTNDALPTADCATTSPVAGS